MSESKIKTAVSKLKYATLIAVAAISVQSASLAHSQGEATLLGKFKSWAVYKGPNNVYFMSSKAENQSGTYSKREEPFLIISEFPDKTQHEVSVYIGYTLKTGAPVNVTVELSYTDPSNTKQITMQSSGERAWAKGNEDQNVISLFKKGAKVKVAAESYRNTTSSDIYSLDGFADAYKMLSEARKNNQ